MKIRSLDLSPFRNFDRRQFVFEGDRTLITGRNGRGKTNVLEAISFLSVGRSARGARDQEAIPHEGAFFDISGTCEGGGRVRRLRLFCGRREGKRAFADDAPFERVSELLGVFRTVHFAPESVSLILRFPAQRRRLLDILISQSSPVYLSSLRRYQRVLSQRNALLRTSDAGEGENLSLWTQQLATLGGLVREHRLVALAAMRAPFTRYARRLVPRGEQLDIQYRGVTDTEGSQEQKLLEQLTRRAHREQELGYTLAGPHRDDLVFLVNGHPAETFASEGQLKSVLIAWKMAEVSFLEQPGQGQPVLLLDDVFSELDESRSRALVEITDEFEQVILTSAQELDPGHIQGFQRISLDSPAE